MTTDAAIALFKDVLFITAKVAGPMLLVALVTGLLVGVLQAATQINEPSVSFVAKVLAMAASFLVMGAWAARQLVAYTAQTLGAIGNVIQ